MAAPVKVEPLAPGAAAFLRTVLVKIEDDKAGFVVSWQCMGSE